MGESFIDHINDYVGNDKPADLNWRMLFTDVFKSHSVEEAEDIFICGTHTRPHHTSHRCRKSGRGRGSTAVCF